MGNNIILILDNLLKKIMKIIFKLTGFQIITLSALAALVLTGCATNVGIQGTTTECIPFTVQTVSGSGCPGAYNGLARMTNSDGTFWISGTNASGSTGTFTDVSSFAAPYASVVQVVRKSDNTKWCAANSVTFPVASTAKYSFTVYVKSPVPPPTNSQPITLQLVW